MTLDHVSFHVSPSEYDKVVAWYLAALAPLGYTKQVDIPGVACGLGDSPQNAKFWIGQREDATTSGNLHLAFRANDHATVDRFHEEGVKAGGKDNGKPGLRPMYHPNYYGAFVFDPVG
jgi:hypothetical protein